MSTWTTKNTTVEKAAKNVCGGGRGEGGGGREGGRGWELQTFVMCRWRISTTPGALFFWLLRERKTMFITQADEAARRIKRHMYGNARKREEWEGSDEVAVRSRRSSERSISELSEDDKIVVACIRVAKQKPLDDPFAVARCLSDGGWTRERWDDARLVYETTQSTRWWHAIGISGDAAL